MRPAALQNAAEHGTARNPAATCFGLRPWGGGTNPDSPSRTRAYALPNPRRIFDGPPFKPAL